MPVVTRKFRKKKLIQINSGSKRGRRPRLAPKRADRRLAYRRLMLSRRLLNKGSWGSRMTPRPIELEEGWAEREQLYREGTILLSGLDRRGLFQAGAHLSMALEVMRRRHPILASC